NGLPFASRISPPADWRDPLGSATTRWGPNTPKACYRDYHLAAPHKCARDEASRDELNLTGPFLNGSPRYRRGTRHHEKEAVAVSSLARNAIAQRSGGRP